MDTSKTVTRSFQDDTRSQLFQYGVADAFIKGIYEGQLSIHELKQQGNFGIGAPNLVDGELTILDGVVYQTKATGETIEAPNTLKTPFAFITAFKAETVQILLEVDNADTLFKRIQALLPNKNGIYALRINGTFSHVRTRAFSPVGEQPFKPLALLLDQQHFFDLNNTTGTLVGFYMPGYLSGINITGMHFHYLSSDRKHGGHVVGLKADSLKLEITQIKGFFLTVPDTANFEKFDFNRKNAPDLKRIEKGDN